MEPIKPTFSSSPPYPHPYGAGVYPRSGDYFQSSSSSSSNATKQTVLGISSAAQAANSAGSPWSSSFGSSSFASSSRRRPYSSLSLSELSCSSSVPSLSMSSVTWSSYWSNYRDMVPLGLRGMVLVGVAAVGGSYGGAGIWRHVWKTLKCK